MSHMNVKPKAGDFAKSRRAKRSKIERAEAKAKAEARLRDEYGCRRCGRPAFQAAHIDDKGMGGDHGLHSALRSDFVTLCHDCHQGPRGLHSGFLTLVVGPLRGDGPVEFIEKGRAA